MPETRHYLVTQTRQVQVTANNASDAGKIAATAFEHGQNSESGIKKPEILPGIWGNTTGKVRETGLNVERVR